MNRYDVIIVGAGSIGVPLAWILGREKMRVLVLDGMPSPGQGENKHAIGGIRATHSSPGKILACLKSLEIFSSWKDTYGDSIEWQKGGYLFPVYREEDEKALKRILPVQRKFGLTIDFVSPGKVRSLLPGISGEGLMGGTFSPDDGSASPLLAINSFFRKALENGVHFEFGCKADVIVTEKKRVKGVSTPKGVFHAPVVVDAAGAASNALLRSLDVTLPIVPESHEGGITEPVKNFFHCMVVDIRPEEGSRNYYFYQNSFGQIVFCLTPDPPIAGCDRRETSDFLPQVGRRMIRLVPRLRHIRVRRMWRGIYPMTPDGFPLVGWNRNVEGLLHATGMCGQGFMLGPGIGDIIHRMIMSTPSGWDRSVLEEFSPDRTFGIGGGETLK